MAKKTKEQVNKITKTVNQQILDDAIRHAVYLEQYKAEQVKEIVKFFNKEVEPDLLKQIDSRLEGSVSRTRQEEVITACNQVCNSGYDQIGKKLKSNLADFGVVEAKAIKSIVENALPIDFDFRTPSLPTIKSMIEKSPIDGQLMDDLLKTLNTSTKNKIAQQIRLGIAEGESIDKIARRIRGTRVNGYNDGVLAASRRSVKAVVRTAVAGVSNNVRDATYSDNEDIVKSVQFLATLDTRTTKTCMALDGQEFEIGQGPRPPMHVNCRSTTVPVLKSWEELGIDLKEAPESTRASMNGQVSEKTTFDDWLKGQNVADQEELLGKNAAKLFRDGKIDVKDLVDQNYQPISLKNLEKTVGRRQQQIYNRKYKFENNLGDIRLDYQDQVVKELDYLTKEYAEVRIDGIELWSSSGYRDRAGKGSTRACADVGKFAAKKNIINFNGYWFEDKHDLARQLSISSKLGNVTSDKVESILTHEFGHLVHKGLSERQDAGIEKIYKTLGSHEIAEKISKYAATNHIEMFAECFVKYRYGNVDNVTESVMRTAGIIK